MLLDIAHLPTAENSVIRLHPADNVAIARVPLVAGTELRLGDVRLPALEPVPAGHKIALLPIAPERPCAATANRSAAPGPPSKPAGMSTRTTCRSKSCSWPTSFRRATRRRQNLRKTRQLSSDTSARTAASAPVITSRWSPPATALRTPPN